MKPAKIRRLLTNASNAELPIAVETSDGETVGHVSHMGHLCRNRHGVLTMKKSMSNSRAIPRRFQSSAPQRCYFASELPVRQACFRVASDGICDPVRTRRAVDRGFLKAGNGKEKKGWPRRYPLPKPGDSARATGTLPDLTDPASVGQRASRGNRSSALISQRPRILSARPDANPG